MCLNLCIYNVFYHQLFLFLYIIVITCKKILKDPLSSFNIYKKIEINYIHY